MMVMVMVINVDESVRCAECCVIVLLWHIRFIQFTFFLFGIDGSVDVDGCVNVDGVTDDDDGVVGVDACFFDGADGV